MQRYHVSEIRSAQWELTGRVFRIHIQQGSPIQCFVGNYAKIRIHNCTNRVFLKQRPIGYYIKNIYSLGLLKNYTRNDWFQIRARKKKHAFFRKVPYVHVTNIPELEIEIVLPNTINVYGDFRKHG